MSKIFEMYVVKFLFPNFKVVCIIYLVNGLLELNISIIKYFELSIFNINYQYIQYKSK